PGAGGGARGGRPVRRRALTMGTTQSLAYFLPELALSVAILAVVFVDLALTGRAGRRASEWPGNLALAGAGAALVLTLGLRPLVRGLLDDPTPAWLFNRMIVLDAFSVFFKVLLGLALLAVVWMSMSSSARPSSTLKNTLNASDRQSTRLNSSHVASVYASYCLQNQKFQR